MSRGTHCISSNIDSTKNADHIFEMPGLGDFYGYCFENIHVKVG